MNKAIPKASLQGLVLVCTLISLYGCEKKEPGSVGSTEAGSLQARAMDAIAPPNQAARQSDTLAYEHTVSIELSRELLPTRLHEVETTCIADQASGCTILEVSLHSNENIPGGSIRMRLAPGGVDSIIGIASKDGKVTARTTQAEDLAQPVADTERELALMTLHRDRLTEFMKSKELKIDQLIAISKELATVQAQMDSLSTQRANLRRRIDTDLLTISMSLPMQDYAADQSPVLDALQFFGSDFSEAVGMVIRSVAVLLPWLVIIVPGLIFLRLFWRWIGRLLARREQRA